MYAFSGQRTVSSIGDHIVETLEQKFYLYWKFISKEFLVVPVTDNTSNELKVIDKYSLRKT